MGTIVQGLYFRVSFLGYFAVPYNKKFNYAFFWEIAACAAASLAIGTRYGEQDT